jgi:hypothetical protein
LGLTEATLGVLIMVAMTTTGFEGMLEVLET